MIRFEKQLFFVCSFLSFVVLRSQLEVDSFLSSTLSPSLSSLSNKKCGGGTTNTNNHLLQCSYSDEGKNNDENEDYNRRRTALMKIFTTTSTIMMMMSSSLSVVGTVTACHAATSSTGKTIDPDTAYTNLRKSREELVFAGRTYFPKQNWRGLREYLDQDDLNMNKYDTNANALLTSKRLDAESKKAIGTIRRYGVGADVIIMYGGMKAELSEDNERPNGTEIQNYYLRTLDSLEEVIAICRSNPGFNKIE